jgi:alpha-glucuronidase
MVSRLLLLIAALAAVLASAPARAEDGYRLWLRYDRLPAARAAALPFAGRIVVEESDATIAIARDELTRALGGMAGEDPLRSASATESLLIGTPRSPRIAALRLPLSGLGDEGFLLRTVRVGGRPVTVIAANRPVGVLYGAFALLRRVQTGATVDTMDIADRPRVGLRMLNHWDNLDRHVERGYAGQSIWDWWRLPGAVDPRYADYARANASIGINGTVLNNVNAKADMLTAPWIAKAKAIADVLRPYGIRVFLSARWSAPVELGATRTADPLDPAVAAWWRAKADEIYRAIPDFGGLLVKANSEGQPGPQDYRRTHADGANMLAAALKPHGGVVLWRAFVYQQENPEDRARQAYSDFRPLDGRFADNVIVQVKNGPIDFQPREPFHPLFGAMPRTPLAMEFQITKEYLGFSTHLAYLAPLYEEVLDAETGTGATVAQVVEGRGHRLSAMAGVANIGSDRNWSGSVFDQANWYAFGRLAWNPGLPSAAIAREWAAMTFTPDAAVVEPVVAMMMGSREAVVDYMTPLGLTHLMATGHHYGPGPWVSDLARPEWNPAYYHRADARGIGFDRTASGSNAVAQYAPAVRRGFADRRRTPEELLLWFHRVGWDERLRSGRTLWEELTTRYDRGVARVAEMRRTWATVAPRIDAERAAHVGQYLAIQEAEAQWWRDASLAYWQSVAGHPLPAGVAPPPQPLSYYKSLSFPFAPGN